MFVVILLKLGVLLSHQNPAFGSELINNSVQYAILLNIDTAIVAYVELFEMCKLKDKERGSKLIYQLQKKESIREHYLSIS